MDVVHHSGQYSKFTTQVISNYSHNTASFFWISVAIGVVLLANLFVIAQLAGQWSKGTRQRLLWTTLLILGTGIVAGYLVWILGWGLQSFSPYLAEVGVKTLPHEWIAAAILVIILITIFTYQRVVERDPISDSQSVVWRRKAGGYYHENRIVLCLLAVAIGVFLQSTSNFMENLSFFSVAVSKWRILSDSIMERPLNIIWLALLFVILHRAITKRANIPPPQTDLPRINPARFAAVWLGALSVAATGIPAVAWLSFAFWFNPWMTNK
jgi:hypothetical protein